MAGSSDSQDNPVHMNVVAMVDIIFCLCVFFMCSFQFKQLEGAFRTWLPKEKGDGPTTTEPAEIRVALLWDADAARTQRVFGHRRLADGDAGTIELATLVRGAREDWIRRGEPDVPLILDAAEEVPWDEAMAVVDLAQAIPLRRVEFARGAVGFARGAPALPQARGR